MPEFRPLRLKALQDHPEAFGADYQEEAAAPDLSRLIGRPPSITLGGFIDGRLVATAGLVVPQRIKQRHKGQVVGVYVLPDCRQLGLARALTERLTAHARTQNLRLLTLTVTAGNEPARRLYLEAGFQPYGTEPIGLCVAGRLYDEELMAKRLD